jgi:hypothetical protein
MTEEKFQFGILVEDAVTGFQGMAIGKCTYISGCTQVLVQPRVGEDKKRVDSEWFDIQRVRQVGADILVLDNGSTPGCDRAAPKR